jgi:zinc D-Ala-D-Ala carboxypeptidase
MFAPPVRIAEPTGLTQTSFFFYQPKNAEAQKAKDALCESMGKRWSQASMQISEHFTLEEMSFSEAAARLGLDNTPGPAIIVNLTRTAATMEIIRALLRAMSINVHSGYRSPQVNRAVGGAATSAHCRGLACDFVCPAFGAPLEIARAILSSAIEFDQLILEYGWVHVGLAQGGALSRREALTKRSAGAAYEYGINA